MALVSAVAMVVAGALALWSTRGPAAEPALFALVLGFGFAALGVAVVRRRGMRAGRLFLLTAAALLAVPPLSALGAERPALVLLGLAMGVMIPAGLLGVLAPHRGGGATALVADVAVLGCGVWAGASLLVPDESGAVAAWSALMAALLVAGWPRFERTAGRSRRQALWLVLGLSSSVLAALLVGFVADPDDLGAPPTMLAVALLSLLLPVAIGFAVLAPDALDVRRVIAAVVVGALMTAIVVAVFSGVLAGFRLLGGSPGAATTGVQGLLVAVLAAGFHPLLVRVRGSVDELLFGGRPDPVRTLTRLGDQLTAGGAPSDWLETLRAALGAPTVLLRRAGAPEVSAGAVLDPAAPLVVTPLRVGAERVGELVVGLPPDQLRPPPTTRAVLGLVAAPLAQAVHAVRLGEQLRASRGRVVAALEEERRRLRHDLHDGLGPTLTGIAYSADAARNLLPPDAERAAAELVALRADAAEAITEIRRIVEGLRPRALDELGLLGALAQRLRRLHAADGRPMTVTFDAPPRLPELPAAVEVVAYRVVSEAVTNVARHAGVDRAAVTLTLADPDRLVITVVGSAESAGPVGPVGDWTPGVGLTSMRERVEQIGGELELLAAPGGGLVRARVPIALDLSGP